MEKARKEGAKPGGRRWANVDEDARRARLYELTVPTRGRRSCNTWNTRRTHPAYVPRCTRAVLASNSSFAPGTLLSAVIHPSIVQAPFDFLLSLYRLLNGLRFSSILDVRLSNTDS